MSQSMESKKKAIIGVVVIVVIYFIAWLVKTLTGNILLLELLFAIFAMIIFLFLMLLFIFPFLYIIYWFNVETDGTFSNEQNIPYLDIFLDFIKTKNIIIQKEILLGLSTGQTLCHEFDDAIKNNRIQNISEYNSQQIQFMIICAKMKRDQISRLLSTSKNIIFLGIGVILINLLRILYQFIQQDFTSLDSMDLLTEFFLSDLNKFLDYIYSINIYLHIFVKLIVIFILFIIGNIVFSSFLTKNSRFKIWLRQHKKINSIYCLIVLIFIIGILLRKIISIQIDIINLSIFFCGIYFILIGLFFYFISSKQINLIEEIILHLNKVLIFDDK